MNSNDKDPYEINDRTILTLVEHRLIASTVDREDMVKNPYKPQAVLDGQDPVEVFENRLKQSEIVSMQSAYFGLETGKMPVVALNVLDIKSGNVSNSEIRVTGIYDFYTEQIDRDPELLKKHQLNEEGRKKFMVEGEVGRREKIG